jgi:hypothetical protein
MLHISQLRPATFVIAAVCAALAVSPAAATSPGEVTGTVGEYQVVDTSDTPGAVCRYQTISQSDQGYQIKLQRIGVRPPRMRAVEGSQRVGWRVVVWRMRRGHDAVVVARSPIQKATATKTRDAAFERIRVAIDAPERSDVEYRAVVRMFWYHSDGTKQGTARAYVWSYRQVKFYGSSVADGPCPAYEAAAV